MSLQHDSASEAEMWDQHDIDQSSTSNLALEAAANSNESVEQDFDSLPLEMDDIMCKESDHAQLENDFTMYEKLTMLQDTFKTVGGDLDEIKTLMFKLRDVLKTDGDEELGCDSKQRHGCSGESSNDISVIEENEASMQDLPLLQNGDKLKCPTRESSTESMDDCKYSTLIADIEVLKNKLVSLKRNLAE
ncbi:uncharacterized protein LOC144654434 [Oculina patagonica]